MILRSKFILYISYRVKKIFLTTLNVIYALLNPLNILLVFSNFKTSKKISSLINGHVFFIEIKVKFIKPASETSQLHTLPPEHPSMSPPSPTKLRSHYLVLNLALLMQDLIAKLLLNRLSKKIVMEMIGLLLLKIWVWVKRVVGRVNRKLVIFNIRAI